MTTLHETDHDAARYTLGAFSYPLRIWGDWVRKFVDPKEYLEARTHFAEEIVDHYFHVLERILAIQHEVAKCVVANYGWTATKAAYTMHEADKGMQDAAKEAASRKDTHDGARESTLKKS